MNQQTKIITALLFLTTTAVTACTPDVALRDLGARNNCNTPIQVEEAEIEGSIGNRRTDVKPGQTAYLSTFGDLGDVYVRVGPVLDDPEAQLDESLPILTYAPSELEIATPEEEEADGYEFYFVIEGDLCP